MTDDERLPAWEQRFRAPRVSLPDWARDAPHRCIYLSNVGGRFEVHAWDRGPDTHRQVTDRPNGTSHATIDPSGEWIWWFDDTDGDELGVWRRQPFAGGPDDPVGESLGRAYSAGLAVGRRVAVVGRSTDERTTVHVVPLDGGAPYLLYEHPEDAHVVGLSHDETLVAIAHSEHGDSRHKALRVVRVDDGTPVAELWDGPGLGLEGVGFAPVPGDHRLLALHERTGRALPLVWDVADGSQQEPPVELPGEVTADWYPDGSALLLAVEAAARSTLHRLDLADGAVTRVETPPGTVTGATARPDGTVEFHWSSSAQPAVVRSSAGRVVLTPPGSPAPGSVGVADVWVESPGGKVHALVSRPEAHGAPYPTVFVVHGGPEAHDRDAFAADVAAYVDHGCAVVRVNYRGSTGYGKAWRDAIEGRPGLTELEDLAAVRDWAVASGLADPDRIALTGGSWGGYLTLLGLGVQPHLWSVGSAAVPVADYVSAYRDEMESLQAYDRALFGGSPDEVPERYTASSPLTYVDAVRAPVLVLAGVNDPRCPIQQIDNYLARLAERGHPHEVYRFDAGHGSLVVAERVRQMRAELDFVTRHLFGG